MMPRTILRRAACDTIVGRSEVMATIPSTEQGVAEDWLVLNLQNVALSDEQFVELCADNQELHLELTARKELVIMTLPPPRTGRRHTVIFADLETWARRDGSGV